jgi:hypothetical protein
MNKDPIELRILRARMALRKRQYHRGGFWPRINFYRTANAPGHDQLPRIGLDRTYGPPISVYFRFRGRCLVVLWRFAP